MIVAQVPLYDSQLLTAEPALSVLLAVLIVPKEELTEALACPSSEVLLLSIFQVRVRVRLRMMSHLCPHP